MPHAKDIIVGSHAPRLPANGSKPPGGVVRKFVIAQGHATHQCLGPQLALHHSQANHPLRPYTYLPGYRLVIRQNHVTMKAFGHGEQALFGRERISFRTRNRHDIPTLRRGRLPQSHFPTQEKQQDKRYECRYMLHTTLIYIRKGSIKS